jgi:hypothetical protein
LEKSPAKRASLNAVVGPACAEESIADGLTVGGNAGDAAVDVKPDAPKDSVVASAAQEPEKQLISSSSFNPLE